MIFWNAMSSNGCNRTSSWFSPDFKGLPQSTEPTQGRPGFVFINTA